MTSALLIPRWWLMERKYLGQICRLILFSVISSNGESYLAPGPFMSLLPLVFGHGGLVKQISQNFDNECS